MNKVEKFLESYFEEKVTIDLSKFKTLAKKFDDKYPNELSMKYRLESLKDEIYKFFDYLNEHGDQINELLDVENEE